MPEPEPCGLYPGELVVGFVRHVDVQYDVRGKCGALQPANQFARNLARRFITVGGVITAFQRRIARSLARAADSSALAPGSSMAQDHGTRYPVLQGPMTRVSDGTSFCASVFFSIEPQPEFGVNRKALSSSILVVVFVSVHATTMCPERSVP